MHCKLDVKQAIINTILTKGLGNTKGVSVEEKKLVVDKEFYGGDIPAKGVATTITDRINRIYSGYPNIAIHNLSAKGYEIRIKVPTALVDTYYDHYIKEYNAQQQAETGINAEGDSSPMYQASLKEANKTKISKESISKLEAFAEKAKVKILDMSRERSQQLAEEAGSKNAYVTAVANALEGTIEILDGKKDVAFAEESAHILVDILEQTNPSLYKEMFNKIGQYKIFDMVLNDPFYANSKHYQKDGKRNIPLFKKEAMGKLLAEMFAQKEGVSSQISIFTLESESEANKAAILKWFNSVLDWFKNLFKKADYNPFEETTEMLRGNKDFVGTVKDVVIEPNVDTSAFLFQATQDLTKLSEKEQNKLESTIKYSLLEDEKNDKLSWKEAKPYLVLKGASNDYFINYVNNNKKTPKTFYDTIKNVKYDKSDVLNNTTGQIEYQDVMYVKTSNHPKSHLYNVVDVSTGEIVRHKIKVFSSIDDIKTFTNPKKDTSEVDDFGNKITKEFNIKRSIAFSLYRQMPGKAKYIAQAKKFLYDALKQQNPEDSKIHINLNAIEDMLSMFPEELFNYINTTIKNEESSKITASTRIQNNIYINLPKLGFIQMLEKQLNIPLNGVSFTNYDRSGKIAKSKAFGGLGVEWGKSVTISNKLTTRQLKTALRYYLTDVLEIIKPTSSEMNVMKYAEHNNIDLEKLKEILYNEDKAYENILYNQSGNSDAMELAKWKQSIFNYNWQAVEIFQKPYTTFYNETGNYLQDKLGEKFLQNDIPYINYFFTNKYNFLNINFNKTSGIYTLDDNSTTQKYFKDTEALNRLASILHEPFHALHALVYGTKEELELQRSFNTLADTAFGKELLNILFENGYNNGTVSKQLAYKEFCAFAFQLMNFPKNWIDKTDLKSNDIYEFVQKIQSLQDKTYDEVVKEWKKIGEETKETVNIEKIQLDFLQKLYNVFVKAVHKLIPISKTFIKLLKDSQLVTEYQTKDLFGTVEKTVTKTEKLPEKIKEDQKAFLDALDELKANINTLMNVDGAFYNSDNVAKFFSNENSSFFQTTNSSTSNSLFNNINNIDNKVIEKENKFYVNDVEVKHTFNKPISKDETIQTINSNGMGDIHSILNRYIDENDVLRVVPLEKKAHQLGKTDAAYNLLDKHISNILNEYPVNTKFIYNTILFNEAKDLAGKADFIAILPDSSVDVLTWDFLADREKGISKNTREELQKYLGHIKVILKEAYNVKKINHARAIPVLINFNFKNNKYTFKSIQVANTKVEDIQKETLLPIPASDDATGNEEIDSFIQRLNSLYKVINDTPVIEGRRDIKYSELSAIYKAIRNLQLKKDFKPLFQQVRIQIDNTQQLLNKHQEMFEAGTFDNYSKEELNEVAKRLDRLSENLEIYKDLDLFFKDFFLTDAKYEEDLQTVRRLSIESRDIINKAEKLIFKFAVKYIADPRKIYDLTSPEATVNTIDKNFRTMSSAPTKAVQTYYLLAEEARNKAELETDELLDELKTIQNNVADWAKTQGLKSFDYTKYLLKKDNKDRIVNQLIDKYSYDFYTTLKDKIKAKDIKWIKQNIDIEAFKQWNEEYRKIKLAQIEETVYLGSPDEQEEQRKFEKESVLRQTDIETGKAYLNYMGVKQFPTDAWYSKEYKEVLKHKPLLDLFNYATKVNTIAKNAGYLDSSNARTFLPFIRKNFAERVIVGGNYNILNNALASLSVNDEMVGYGNFNPITNEIEDTIPKYFTRDISETKKDSSGEEYQDYGNVSLDIFKNLGIYTKQVVDYREKKNIEGLANILYFVEKNKKSLQTNQFGNLITNAINHPNESNEINAKFFKNFLKNHLYGQKYITTDSSDMLLGVPESAVKFWNKTVEKFNKTLGTNIPVISEEVASRNLSAVKTIDTLNKFFTIKTLGINLASSIAQFMGGNFQAIVNSGKYWTKAQWFASEWNASSHKILGGKENIHLALMKTFLPLGDEKVIRDLEKMSLIKANQHSTSDILMTLMRKADNIIQYTNFLAMMDNAIVIDGKLVNARTYYNETPEYQNRYNLSVAERKELENKYESKIKELVEKYGVIKNSKIVNGKLVIEGASTDSIYKYRSLVQQVGKRLAGNISSNDENQIRMTVLGRSFMMFKNWIPGALYQRFQPLTYIVGTDSYEWGRMRMTYNYFFSAIVPKVKSISAVISGTEEGLKIMSDLYEKERKNYYEKHNKELHISKTDFYDLVRQNLQAQIKDVILLLTLLALFLSAKAMAPDDDEDKATKNAYGYALRTIDNVVNEMSFYYNPANIQHVLGGNLFPALGVFSDVTKALTNIGQEIFGMVFGVDEWKESAKPLKYIMKTFPVSKEMLNYLAIFYPETATEMGIIINSKSRK